MEPLFEISSVFSENTTDNPTILNGGAIQNSSHSSFYSSDTITLLPTWWKLFDEKYLRHSFEWTAILVTAYVFILVTGIIGNIMVILVVYLRPQMRSVTNIFILNLAVADLLVIMFCVPATLMSNVFAPWILGSFMCKGVAYVQGVSVCASAYSLAAISLDRCKAIYKSHGRSNGLSKNQALITIFLIWISSIMLIIPWAVTFNVTDEQSNGISYCVETWSNDFLGKLYFVITNFILGYCFPLLLISISNFVIWCHVKNRKVPRDSDSSGSIRKMHRKARHGVVKMLGIVTLVFLLSWLPLYVLVMRIKFGENVSETEYNLHGSLMPFAQWLGSWSSSVNPILYAFLNKKYRKMFKSLLPSWMPFVRQKEKSFVTRGTLTRTTLRANNFERQQSRMSIFAGGCNRSDSRSSRKILISEGRPTRRCSVVSASVVNVRESGGTGAIENIEELSTSSVVDIGMKTSVNVVPIINTNVVVIANIGVITDV